MPRRSLSMPLVDDAAGVRQRPGSDLQHRLQQQLCGARRPVSEVVSAVSYSSCVTPGLLLHSLMLHF
jgi:hypothetical protein